MNCRFIFADVPLPFLYELGDFLNFKLIVSLLLTVFFNALSQVLIKKGVGGQIFSISLSGVWAAATNKLIVAGLLTQAVAFYCWLRVLSSMNLSVAFPLMISILLLGILVSSVFFLGERVTLVQGMGVILLISGIFCITYR